MRGLSTAFNGAVVSFFGLSGTYRQYNARTRQEEHPPALTDPRSSCSCYLSQKGNFPPSLPPYVFFRSVSSPSASTVAALDQAFSQLHIVPPIQSNPHAIPDSCSTTLSLSSLAFPRKVFKAWLRGGREKWVIIPDDATGGRAGDHGTGWIGLSLSSFAPSLLTAICSAIGRTCGPKYAHAHIAHVCRVQARSLQPHQTHAPS